MPSTAHCPSQETAQFEQVEDSDEEIEVNIIIPPDGPTPIPLRPEAELSGVEKEVLQPIAKAKPPFPGRFAQKARKEDPMDFMAIFSKLEVSIPFMEALKLPSVSKFIKDCIYGKSKADGKIVVGENVSAVIQNHLPSKCKDPGMFSLSITIGDVHIPHAMCDLGASINVMPLSIYNRLVGVEMSETKVVIQLADRSCICPEGVLENVIVKVHEFQYPADFYVIRMNDVMSRESNGVLLGRPFLRTAKSMINVFEGTICLDYHGEKYTFGIDDAMKRPLDVENANSLDIIDPMVQDYLEAEFLQDRYPISTIEEQVELEANGMSELFSSQGLTDEEIEAAIMKWCNKLEHAKSASNLPSLDELPSQSNLPSLRAEEELVPSEVRPPKLELKPLPANLKYVYLGETDTLPVIINSGLEKGQEQKLIKLLKGHKKAIGWTLADITGISPDVCMHYINLEENAKPHRDPQRKLNPNMREVVMKEVLKLLSIGIIYPIPDSKWVSPIHMVPKKSGIQVVENANNELVPTRLVTGWRMCIDYRRLNEATRKDHFPLPFIDQMLERLPGKKYFSFLDGYSGYFQIFVNPDHQEKTTFTCPFGTYAYRRMPFGLCNAP